MVKRRHKPKRRFKHKKQASQDFLIDTFSINDIKKWKKTKDEFLKYQWDLYYDLAYQRSNINTELKKSLLNAAIKNFQFKNWQRAVKYKYALEPLSMEGSIADPGGRFNIGDIKPAYFHIFKALYIAENKNTATQELLCQSIKKQNRLNYLDFALTKPDSVVYVSVSGKLSSVIDLTQPKKLNSFVDLIKNFTFSEHISQTARKNNWPEPGLIKSTKKLIEILSAPDWRIDPMRHDIPSSSQIFGQLVCNSGIEGILYPSKYSGDSCLVIFPQNFNEISRSYVQLDDELPKGVKTRRLDAVTWKQYRKYK